MVFLPWGRAGSEVWVGMGQGGKLGKGGRLCSIIMSYAASASL